MNLTHLSTRGNITQGGSNLLRSKSWFLPEAPKETPARVGGCRDEVGESGCVGFPLWTSEASDRVRLWEQPRDTARGKELSSRKARSECVAGSVEYVEISCTVVILPATPLKFISVLMDNYFLPLLVVTAIVRAIVSFFLLNITCTVF